ncbi:MAG: pitrilysin family protein [Actinomycetota bacterium]|nr:pitrilysin family protein [Actinomycetota bacterium]
MSAITRPEIGVMAKMKAPSVVEALLAGRLPALAARRTALPIVELRLAVPLRRSEVEHPAVTSVLTESLLAGTEQRDRFALADALERVGGELHANLGDDQLVIAGSVLSANLGAFLALLNEVLCAATYPEREVRADRARAADETEIALSQPEVVAAQALRRRQFAGHPYATTMASPAALRKVRAEELRALHRQLFVPSACHLVLVGDLSPRRALSLSEEALGPFLAGRGRRRDDIAALSRAPFGPIELVDRPGSVQANLRVGASAPGLADPSWPAFALAEAILGGMFSSRIVTNLRERHGYTYSPHTGVRHARAGSSFVLAAEVATAVTGPALVEARYELARIVTAGVTDTELESARRYSTGRFAFQTGTLGGLASTLARLSVNGVGSHYLASYPAALARATKEEVEAAARRFLAPRDLVTVVVGEAASVHAALSLLEEVRTTRR